MFYIVCVKCMRFISHFKKRDKKRNKKYIGVNEMLNNLLYEN